jgi:hypothetical protein
MGLIMLLYPVFDAHHCVFRMLRILSAIPDADHELERIRIMDFYLVFPQMLTQVRFPKGFTKTRKALLRYNNSYNDVQDAHRTMIRMEPIQHAALSTLASHGLLDSERYRKQVVRRTNTPIPASLQQAVSEANDKEQQIIELFHGPLSQIGLYGFAGLKARTDLFEYRYDSV